MNSTIREPTSTLENQNSYEGAYLYLAHEREQNLNAAGADFERLRSKPGLLSVQDSNGRNDRSYNVDLPLCDEVLARIIGSFQHGLPNGGSNNRCLGLPTTKCLHRIKGHVQCDMGGRGVGTVEEEESKIILQ